MRHELIGLFIFVVKFKNIRFNNLYRNNKTKEGVCMTEVVSFRRMIKLEKKYVLPGLKGLDKKELYKIKPLLDGPSYVDRVISDVNHNDRLVRRTEVYYNRLDRIVTSVMGDKAITRMTVGGTVSLGIGVATGIIGRKLGLNTSGSLILMTGTIIGTYFLGVLHGILSTVKRIREFIRRNPPPVLLTNTTKNQFLHHLRRKGLVL